MRRWKPQPSARLWLGIALLAISLAASLFLLIPFALTFTRPPTEWPLDLQLYLKLLGAVGLLLISGILAYRVGAALSLSYSVDRNGLYIFWLGNRAVVPLAGIESVESGVNLAETPRSLLQSIGYYHGQVHLPEGRTVHRFTSQPLARSLVLHTNIDSYAISPSDAEAFVQELEQRRRLGAIQQLSAGVEVGRVFFYSFWSDRLVRQALVAAFIFNLLLLGWLALIYPGLPSLIELRADQVGVTAELRPRHQILYLPLAAAVIYLFNIGLGLSIYSRDAQAARLLQIASLLASLLFAVAMLTILV